MFVIHGFLICFIMNYDFDCLIMLLLLFSYVKIIMEKSTSLFMIFSWLVLSVILIQLKLNIGDL